MTGVNDELADIYTDVERAYASCVLGCGKPHVLQAVRPEQIADPIARTIVETAAQLLAEGTHPDLVTVSARLRFVHRDWPVRLTDVHQHPGAVWANWRTYAALVVEGDVLRQATAKAQRVIQAAERGDVAAVRDALGSAGEVVR